jgi:glycosyltransferase involved in cell wall biosynthesis
LNLINVAPDVSIVIPLYNEEECVSPLLAELRRVLAGFDRTTEVILVDDGSTDRTADLVERELPALPGFSLVHLRKNSGQTAAMAAGMHLAKGEVIVFMDGDLQNDPADVPRLVAKLDEGYDLVSGWRRDRKDRALTRRFPSILANAMIGWTTGVKLHDYGCTLKAYRAKLLKPLELYSDMHRFMPALAWRSGARITEVVVSHRARLLGSSKYGLNRVVKVAFDLLTIQMIVHFSSRPMHFFGVASITFLLLSLVAAGFWAGNIAKNWDWSIVLPAIIVLFFVSFLYFLFLGLLAELIHKVGRTDPADVARSMAEVL